MHCISEYAPNVLRPAAPIRGRLLVFVLATLLSLPLWASSASGTVEVAVYRMLAVTTVNPMTFGGVMATSSPGTVTLNPDGSRSSSGGALMVGGAANAALFMVEGMAGRDFQVKLPVEVVVADGQGNTIHMDNLVASQDVGELGVSELRIGGRLKLQANQAVGNYSGTMTVEVTYR